MKRSASNVDYRRSADESRCAPTCSIHGCHNVAVWLYKPMTKRAKPRRMCERCVSERGDILGRLWAIAGVQLRFVPLPLPGDRVTL